MYWTGLTFNIVTSVNIILSVGIAVDYAAHVAHSFLSTKGTPRERAKGALDHIGGEVLAGAVTTWYDAQYMLLYSCCSCTLQFSSIRIALRLWQTNLSGADQSVR